MRKISQDQLYSDKKNGYFLKRNRRKTKQKKRPGKTSRPLRQNYIWQSSCEVWNTSDRDLGEDCLFVTFPGYGAADGITVDSFSKLLLPHVFFSTLSPNINTILCSFPGGQAGGANVESGASRDSWSHGPASPGTCVQRLLSLPWYLKEHSLDSVPQPTAPPVREEILQQDIFQDVDFEPMVWTGRFSIYPLRTLICLFLEQQ
jgi:hypothetical protein